MYATVHLQIVIVLQEPSLQSTNPDSTLHAVISAGALQRFTVAPNFGGGRVFAVDCAAAHTCTEETLGQTILKLVFSHSDPSR